MDLPGAFAGIAAGISAALGGPYVDGAVLDLGTAIYDDGGSIVTPATPSERACRVQVDTSQQAIQAAGYVDADAVFIILAATLAGSIDTDARVRVEVGPHAGTWEVGSLKLDAVGIGWTGKGRRA